MALLTSDQLLQKAQDTADLAVAQGKGSPTTAQATASAGLAAAAGVYLALAQQVPA